MNLPFDDFEIPEDHLERLGSLLSALAEMEAWNAQNGAAPYRDEDMRRWKQGVWEALEFVDENRDEYGENYGTVRSMFLFSVAFIHGKLGEGEEAERIKSEMTLSEAAVMGIVYSALQSN